MTAVHPGVDIDQARAATPWGLAVSTDLDITEPPTGEELTKLRALQATENH